MNSKQSSKPKGNPVADAIQHVIDTTPRQIDEKVYNSPFKRFKLVEDALDRLGYHNAIVRHNTSPGEYRYQVLVNYKSVKYYMVRQSAKSYLARLYLKLIRDEESKAVSS